MADLNRKMAEGHTVSDLDTVIDEVYGAHGDYDTLGDRLDDIDTIIDTAKLGIHYKGEVNYYSNLPTTGVSIGDAYTVKYAGSSGTTPDGTEYVWGTVSGTNQWINFSKDSYTKAEVDALLALKVDTAGTGLSKSGTTLNHSNNTTAKTTQGFAQIAYDAQGHITGSTAATTAQANAINSGIDSTKVEQIETNKNNILLNARNGVSNYINAPDKTIADSDFIIAQQTSCNIPTGAYYLTYNSTQQSSGDMQVVLFDSNRNRLTSPTYTSTTGDNIFEFTITDTAVTVEAFSVRAGTYSNFMIIPKSLYDAGFTNYQPYALSNAELTAKEQANENNISTIQQTIGDINSVLEGVL